MKHRVFTAITLPPHITAEVGKLQLKLDKLRLPINWEQPDKIHLTLNFTGKLEDEEIHKVRQILKNITQAYRSFRLQPVYLDKLYIRHEPSIIYLAIADKDEVLVDLHKELTRLVDVITPQPQKKFLPHVTIGRVRKSDPTLVKQALDKLSETEIDPLPEFTVTTIDLYESFVSKAGSSYVKLGSFILGNSREALVEVI